MVCSRFYNLIIQILFVPSHNLSYSWEVFSSCSLKSFKNSGSSTTDDVEPGDVTVEFKVVGGSEVIELIIVGAVVLHDGGVRAGEDSVERHSVVVGGAGVVDLDGAVAGSSSQAFCCHFGLYYIFASKILWFLTGFQF